MNQIRLYDLFRKELHLPDDKAAEFVKAVGEVAESEVNGKYDLLATKDDIRALKSDMYVLKSDMHVLKSDMHFLKSDIYVLKNDIQDFKSDMHVLRGDLELRIEQSKTDIYKAMFLTGIAQLIAILSGTLAIVKWMK